uniref:ATP synthase subunit a n=1 Tax=Zygeupolia rubens TaxID=166045 RepID=I1SR67_9BILA|nr:ATP synthase F0 subunit 6 [Zygeupolia rubens]ADZ05387.1 ATP synthase F0 subunit 6 [Zygeupolia rubens]
MLMDIFSSFDEQNGNFLSFGLIVWVLSFSFLFILFSSFWWLNGRFGCFIDGVKSFIEEQVVRGHGRSLGGFGVVVGTLMFFLLCANLGGLIPYVFSSTSHLVVTFSLAVVLWLSLLLSSAFFNVGSFVAVLLPAGAPLVLNPFLVLVETVSLLVRPITLSVRLAANMGAGHIVLCLVGNYLSSGFFCYSSFAVFLMVFVSSFYFLFEVGICMIQSYIFFLLLNLYADEHC